MLKIANKYAVAAIPFWDLTEICQTIFDEHFCEVYLFEKLRLLCYRRRRVRWCEWNIYTTYLIGGIYNGRTHGR